YRWESLFRCLPPKYCYPYEPLLLSYRRIQPKPRQRHYLLFQILSGVNRGCLYCQYTLPVFFLQLPDLPAPEWNHLYIAWIALSISHRLLSKQNNDIVFLMIEQRFVNVKYSFIVPDVRSGKKNMVISILQLNNACI